MGASYFQRNLDSLNIDGRLFIIGTQGGAKTELNITSLFAKRLTVQGIVPLISGPWCSSKSMNLFFFFHPRCFFSPSFLQLNIVSILEFNFFNWMNFYTTNSKEVHVKFPLWSHVSCI